MCDVILVGSHFWRAWGLGSPDGFQNILMFSSRKDILRDFPNNKRFGLWISSRLSWFGSDAAWDECVFSSATLAAMGLNAAAWKQNKDPCMSWKPRQAAGNPYWAIDSPDVLKIPTWLLWMRFFHGHARPLRSADWSWAWTGHISSLGSTQQLSGMGVMGVMAGAAEALI